MIRVSRLMLIILAASWGTYASAEPPEVAPTVPSGARRLFALPSGSLSIEEARRIVEEEESRLMGSEEKRLQVDAALFSTGPKPDELASLNGFLVEKNGDNYTFVVRDAGGAPIVVRRNGHVFWLDRPGKWRALSDDPWCYSIGEEGFSTNDPSKLAPGESHDVRIDLSGPLKKRLSELVEKAEWNARSRTLTVALDDGTSVAVRFRSPDDQLRYGFLWARVAIQAGAAHLVVSGFARHRTDFFTATAEVDEIAQAVAAAEADIVPRNWNDTRTDAPEQEAAALAMEAMLASEPYRRPEMAAARETIDSALRAIADDDGDVVDAASETPAEAATLVPVLTKTLCDLADAMARDLEGYPDDPSLVWREAQAHYGAMRLHRFRQTCVSSIVVDGSALTRPLRASLCDALFDLGEPPVASVETRWDRLRQDPFLDSLLRAHRLEPIEEKHVEACLAELRAAEAGSELENLAVEVLLRVDSRPPEESGAVERWWRGSVVEASGGRRLRSLVVLTGCEFGREMILKRLSAEEMPENVRRDVVRALSSRIDAAERTGRDEAIDAAQRDVVWRAVATAPPGFAHPRSGMIGTLLEDIEKGLPFDEVASRFAAKMHPLQYMRPQAAPSAGNIGQAEKLIASLSTAGSLARRFARVEEIDALWRPAPSVSVKRTAAGVFGHLSPKDKTSAPSLVVPPQTVTWEKFARTALPTAVAMEARIPSRGDFAALLTAENADAPPILQWDTPNRRNPFSIYVYHGGSSARDWNLNGGAWAKVAAVCLNPSQWYGGNFPHHGKGAILIIEGAKDRRECGNALFPETLKSDFHGIRATIEAYSRNAMLAGREEASACGLMFYGAHVRVTDVDGATIEYRLDRLD